MLILAMKKLKNCSLGIKQQSFNNSYTSNIENHIVGVMVSVLAPSGRSWVQVGWVKPMTIKVVFVASPLSMQY
jgi:hypothetical protein